LIHHNFWKRPKKDVAMTRSELVKTSIPLTAEQITKHIEEAAYYKWLNRGQIEQVSDELNDWIEAEKEVAANPSLMLAAPTPSIPSSDLFSHTRTQRLKTRDDVE
jgi:hypothetical protein